MPQVWIERADIERARPVLEDYELRAQVRRAAAQSPVKATGTAIAVLCEECGKKSEFPDTQKGLVANCPHCGGYVDVGDDEEFEGWEESSETNEEEI